MNMKRLLPILALALAAALPVQAAPPTPADLDDLLLSADIDGDGLVTKEEFLELRAAMFPALDTDASGSVSQSELEAVLNDRIQRFSSKAFRKIDADGDGAVSQKEWAGGPARGFDLADKNKDGVLNEAERARQDR